jgi:hypothetical protein
MLSVRSPRQRMRGGDHHTRATLWGYFSQFWSRGRRLRHVHYLGRYRNPSDLPTIYGDVHFSWAIDYYERGLNSAWLSPCRMYEGSLYGSVPALKLLSGFFNAEPV